MDVKTQFDGSAVASPTIAGEDSAQSEQPESLASFSWFLIKLLMAVLIFRSFIFAPFSIPSESMLPRLWNGDYLLAAKWPYGFSNYSLPFSAPLIPSRILASQPERGDVVIFKHPIDKTDYIKRVIGLPGDTIALIDGQVILNGEALPQRRLDAFEIPVSVNTSCHRDGSPATDAQNAPVCRYTRMRETLPSGVSYDVLEFGILPGRDTFPAQGSSEPFITVPEGQMFLLGDNRDNSLDSRFEASPGLAIGVVPQDLLVAEATIIVWSTDGSAEWLNPLSWFSATRWDRIGSGL